MKKLKSKKTFTLLLFTIVVATGIVSLILESPTAANEFITDPLTLRIATPSRKFLLSEPIPMDFELSNQTTSSVSWSAFIALGPATNIIVQPEHGAEFKWVGAKRSVAFPSSSGKTMQSGQSKKVPLFISESFTKILFPQPGRYQLRLEFIYMDYTLGEQEERLISSQPIPIEIEQPQGRNRVAFDYIRERIDPLEELGDSDQQLQIRGYFADHFSDTPYWKYKAFDLAERYFKHGRFAEAEELYYNLSDIDFHHAKRVKWQLAQCANKFGRVNARTRRAPDLTNAPVAIPIPFPNISARPIPPIPAPILIVTPTPQN